MTEYKRRALQAEREYQEKVHLKMVRRSYLKQRREGRHGAIEQPRYAISWKTRTFHDLPGHPCLLDQCQFEAMMPDSDGKDQYIKKPTRLQCTDEGMANQLSLLCPGDHYHLPLEGSSPGVGNRAAASGVYQGVFCNCISKAIVDIFINQDIEDSYFLNAEVYTGGETVEQDELDFDALMDMAPDPPSEEPEPHQEVQRRRGVLRRLDEENKQAAKRTIMRLHRNLGHPSTKELVRLLKSKNASDTLLQAAQEHECGLCDLHKRPTGVPVSSMPKDTEFNQRVQADTLWIKVPGIRNKQPVLMMSDAMTRLLAARHLKARDHRGVHPPIGNGLDQFLRPHEDPAGG